MSRVRNKAIIALCIWLLTILLSFSSAGLGQTLQEYRGQVGRLIRDYQWGEALELATMALDQHPKDPQLLVVAAALMVQLGQPEQGERLIETALTTTIHDPDLLGVVAEFKLSQGELLEASRLFERALKSAPGNARLHYRFSRLLFARGQEEAALKHAGSAVELDEKSTDYRRFYAAMLERAGQPEDAYEQLRLARLHSPADARILLRLSDTLKKRNRPDQALEYLEMASAIDPENPLYWRELGDIYDMLGAVDQSREVRSKASRLEGAFQAYAEAVGSVRHGDDLEAAEILEPAVGGNPEFVTGAVLLGDLYRRLGEKEKALSIYRKVLERDPSRARVKEETAWLYVDKGELGTALEILAETDPEDVTRTLLEGYQQLVNADWEGALRNFKTAEARHPLNPRILQQISLCLHSMGRPDEALTYLEKAHNIQPENREIDDTARLIRFEYGLNLEKVGRWDEAVDIFEGLRNEDDEQADYFFHEAYSRQHLWDYRRAIELYQAGLQLDARAAWVRINLANCLYALSLYDEAADQWRILVEVSPNPEYVYNLGLARIRQWKLDEGWSLIAQAAEAGFEPARQLQSSRKKRSAALR